MKKFTFILAACIFLVASYLLYTSLDASNAKKKEFYERGKLEIGHLEHKLRQLETDLQKNENLIGDIRGSIYKIVGNNGEGLPITSVDQLKSKFSRKPRVTKKTFPPGAFPVVATEICEIADTHSVPNSDVQMLDMYDILRFDNPDGGVWKQGWDIQYDKNTVEKERPKLEIVVIPHSHCDPGWIKTFERYYEEQSKHILDNAVGKLSSTKAMSFIYAEMSFFEHWWRDSDESRRNAVKKLLSNGQFEIATGAWVMTDEANSHYFAMIDQMIEGHQWLENHLDYRPKNHWSIDPFGLSSTMAYLTRLANFSTMSIQRVHYSVKKHLASKKQLEFMWRPLWKQDSAHDILTHMFPFYSYDVPHTCGPDPKVCCQFDFKRLPGTGVSCPWNVPPVPITDSNVAERAFILLDQYRKKAELYQSNVLLVPLGDDFRYDTRKEWDDQFTNYNKLFQEINANTEWNAHIQFGTLESYFSALRKRTNVKEGEKPQGFPVVSGDFFTYADRDDHYWSGYYTSRPFYKRMDRVLQFYLRGAEIAFSLSIGLVQRYGISGFPKDDLFIHLVNARRNLALFQHHDGITGTAKDGVVADYGHRMLSSIHGCKAVIAAATHLMLTPQKSAIQIDLQNLAFDISERRVSQDSEDEKIVVPVSDDPRSIVVYNSLGQERGEVVCFYVNKQELEVRDSNGETVSVQINPLIYKNNGHLQISSTVYEACFVAEVKALGLTQYVLRAAGKMLESVVTAEITSGTEMQTSKFTSKTLDNSDVIVESPYYTARFDSRTGFLQGIRGKDEDVERKMDLHFVKYGTTRKKDKSGAYLFLPDGQAKAVSVKDNQVVLLKGPIITTLIVLMPNLKHTVRVGHAETLDAASLDISNVVDITSEVNYELVMRVKSDIKNNERVFYTDLNGLQMAKRKYFDKIPLQGNVYPMPSAAYLEDDKHRLTLASGQPLGVASLEIGWLEVFLDRRLMQDDNRGLFQGVMDNKLTSNRFKLTLESKTPSTENPDARAGHLSLLGHYTSLLTLHPLFLLYRKETHKQPEVLGAVWGLSSALPCDVHLVNLRTLQQPQDYSRGDYVSPHTKHALILQRLVFACSSTANPPLSCTTATNGQISFDGLFHELTVQSVEKRSLTLMYKESQLQPTSTFTLQPMDIASFVIGLK